MGFVAESAGHLEIRLEHDFRISSDQVIVAGSLLQKAAANLSAIRLLKKI